MSDPINVFVIYAREDREIKQGLLRHLNPLKNPYNLSVWHDDHIEPGQEWKPSIESRLAKTDLFLLLVSADFMNSEFIHQVEFKFALDRHKQGKSIVIPVIIDYCLWDIDINYTDGTFNLKDLQVLPDDARPIGEWKTAEQAYNNIASGIRRVLSTIKENRRQDTISNIATNLAKKSSEEDIKLEKEETVKEEESQKPIPIEIEKQEPVIDFSVTKQAEYGNARVIKRIIYSLLVVVAASIVIYLIFLKPENTLSGTDGTSSTVNNDSGRYDVDTSTSAPTNLHKDESKTPKNNSGSSGNVTNVPINSFNTFPNALAAVFRDARKNFANLKGAYAGTDEEMEKFKTRLVLRDKNFRPSYLLQNEIESQFVFVNTNVSDYESIKSAVLNLLKTEDIKFEYEPSASAGFEKFYWNNEEFEIMLLRRKHSDNFVEIRFFHRKRQHGALETK